LKALVFDHYGKAEEVLSLREVPMPEPGPGQVLVKMLFSPVNPSDLTNTIEGTYRDAVGKAIWNFGKPESAYAVDPGRARMLPEPPLTPGLEGVGVVVKAGAGLYPRYLVGKRVSVVGARQGNWQEYNIAEAKLALPVKAGISDEQAAVSFVNPVTAYAMIHEVLRVERGALVLQSAGNSELGKMIIRLGKSAGFHTISLVRDGAQADGLRAIGADHVIDLSRESLRERVHQITGGTGVKYALDPIAGSLASDMVQCLGLNGRMLVYGTLTGEPLHFSSRDLMTPLASVQGFFLTNWMATLSLPKKLGVIRKTAALVRSGELQSYIRQVYPLEEFRAAIEDVRQPGNRGKVLLRLNPSE